MHGRQGQSLSHIVQQWQQLLGSAAVPSWRVCKVCCLPGDCHLKHNQGNQSHLQHYRAFQMQAMHRASYKTVLHSVLRMSS
mmetsp:Transcript_21723/g.51550  ORF Transcript_21723/g.51550 Transcript_21723/m.51550 type:complete len:81 (+) Transcript_21723:1050-1292(+)